MTRGNQYKFGEPSKLINFRVPQSRVSEFRAVIQKSIDDYYFNGSVASETQEAGEKAMLKRLYEIMNGWLLGKMTQRQISNIPDEVLAEIKEVEGYLNV